jgi:hypothetical protein
MGEPFLIHYPGVALRSSSSPTLLRAMFGTGSPDQSCKQVPTFALQVAVIIPV